MVENMLRLRKILGKPKYREASITHKVGLRNTRHLTYIFEHFGISIEGYDVEHVKPLWIIKKESLKTIKIYKITNKGFVF